MNAFGMQKIKYMNDAVPYVKKILKKHKYSDDDLREILKDENKLQEFSEFLYGELPTHLKVQIRLEDFVVMMKEKTKQELKKKKNKKKVYGKKGEPKAED